MQPPSPISAGSACTVNKRFKCVPVQCLCGVTHSSDQLPADITDAGRQPEEMGIAQDEQPQLQFQIDKTNYFFPSGHSGKGCTLLSGPFSWGTSKASLNLPRSHCGDNEEVTREAAGKDLQGHIPNPHSNAVPPRARACTPGAW